MQTTLQHLFKKNHLQEIPVESLQQVASEFPYFPVGQFLLARKLKEMDNASYHEQFQKTLLYFHNPLWLQYKLAEPISNITESSLPASASQDSEPVESFNDPEQLSHDTIEQVVLHQEVEYSTQPEATSVEVSLEAHAPALMNGLNDPETPPAPREEPFTFQAYYTVDYFASQGIKLSHDHQQQDKLGKQLKSFTEWLKTMRRLPETSVVEILDKIHEGEIATIAAHSLEEREVVTEAMAEVLVKQGQLQKALNIYNKLSLQNPHKSSYFAARIEDLKQH